MSYVIACDDPGFEPVCAKVASDALILAQDLAEQHKGGVRISLPDGETLQLRQFAALLRIDRATV